MLTIRNTTRASERVHLSQSAMRNVRGRLRDYFEDELPVQVGQQMELTPRALCCNMPCVTAQHPTDILFVEEFVCAV